MNAYEIYQNIKPSIIVDLFQWMRDEQRDLYKHTIATLANDRKLRPVFVQKKPVAQQFEWIHKTLKLKSTNMVGEHLFQTYFMQGQQDLLVAFCDAMEIPHDGKGAVDAALPEILDPAVLKAAIDTLLEKFDPQLVTLYLLIFNQQTENGWDSLTELLDSDQRLTLSAE